MRYAILTLALFFCGCPNPSSTGQQARLDLKIDQPDQAPTAGATRQLTLQFGGQGQAMLGAMIDKQNPPTTWHADPADAACAGSGASFALDTSRVVRYSYRSAPAVVEAGSVRAPPGQACTEAVGAVR